MKSGSAAIVQFALEPQKVWKRLTSGGVLVKNWRPAHATAASASAIHTPPMSSTSSSTSSTKPVASGVTSEHFREIARRLASLFGQHVRGLLAAKHRQPLVHERDEEDRNAGDDARLRNPDRNLDEALRELAE